MRVTKQQFRTGNQILQFRNACFQLRQLIGFSRKTPHAAMYGFTWLAGPKGEHRAPSHAYEKWKRDGNTRAQFLTETGSVSKFEVETSASIGANIEPEEMEIRQFSDVSYLSETEPQTVYQGIGAPDIRHPDWTLAVKRGRNGRDRRDME